MVENVRMWAAAVAAISGDTVEHKNDVTKLNVEPAILHAILIKLFR